MCWETGKGPENAQPFSGVEVMISGCNIRSYLSQHRRGYQFSNSPGVWEHRVGGSQWQASACAGWVMPRVLRSGKILPVG